MSNVSYRAHSLLHRGNLRDIVVGASCLLALFCPVNGTMTAISLLLLVAGCFLHLLVKGVLIRNTVLCRGEFTGSPATRIIRPII